MGEVGLWRLRVVESPVAHSSPGGSEGERAAVKQVPTPVSVFSSLVDDLKTKIGNLSSPPNLTYLVKCREYVVSKLDLSYSVGTRH